MSKVVYLAISWSGADLSNFDVVGAFETMDLAHAALVKVEERNESAAMEIFPVEMNREYRYD